MRTLKRNYFVGIRTPWTLANENVWRITHEHVGKVWFYASVVGLVLSFFVPEIYSIFLVVAITLTLTVYACWFSYHVFTLEK